MDIKYNNPYITNLGKLFKDYKQVLHTDDPNQIMLIKANIINRMSKVSYNKTN